MYLGTTGTKFFVDETLPAGAAAVTYRVQAVRSTAAGPVATFNVHFGVAPGTAPASVVQIPASKVAA